MDPVPSCSHRARGTAAPLGHGLQGRTRAIVPVPEDGGQRVVGGHPRSLPRSQSPSLVLQMSQRKLVGMRTGFLQPTCAPRAEGHVAQPPSCCSPLRL